MLATDQAWHKEEKKKITCGISEYLPIYRIANKAGVKYNTIQYNTIQYNTIQYNVQYNTIVLQFPKNSDSNQSKSPLIQ